EAWSRLGEDRKAIADYNVILKLKLSRVRQMVVTNNVAFILATSADNGVRDGKGALALAEKARELEERPGPDVLDTMAAAYAELGDFEQAIRTQQEAINLAAKERREKPFVENLKLYEAHKPRRASRAKTKEDSAKEKAPDNNSGAGVWGPAS